MDYIVLQHKWYISDWLAEQKKNSFVRFRPDSDRTLNHVVVASTLENAKLMLLNEPATDKPTTTKSQKKVTSSTPAALVFQGTKDATLATEATIEKRKSECYANFEGGELFALPSNTCKTFVKLLDRIEDQVCEAYNTCSA